MAGISMAAAYLKHGMYGKLAKAAKIFSSGMKKAAMWR